MRIFSIRQDDVVLCDSPFTYADLRRYRPGDMFGRQSRPRVETILCAVEGNLFIAVAGRSPIPVRHRQTAHIPAGVAWAASAGPQAVKVLRVDSLHPDLDPAQALMPALADVEVRDIADGLSLTFTDYVRSRVLNFAPGFAADRHFHEGADEMFWFYRGTARIITPDQDVMLPEDSIIINPAGEWHVIANGSAADPLMMFLTVTPNVTPSHTFFDADGQPVVRSMQPLTRP